jgi:hypothetical protein
LGREADVLEVIVKDRHGDLSSPVSEQRAAAIESLLDDALSEAYGQGARQHGLDIRSENLTDKILDIIATTKENA